MNAVELKALFSKLIADGEHETIEFKQANDNYSTSDIGKYFSALANEANLRNIEKAWLVFGVNDKTHAVVNCDYRLDVERLQSLKSQIAALKTQALIDYPAGSLQRKKSNLQRKKIQLIDYYYNFY